MSEEARSTKGQILFILKKKGKLSIADLARELDITPMGVRQHLSAMERDGLISTKIMRKPMGRPVYLYFLTERADNQFSKQYEEFLAQFIEGLIALEGKECFENVLRCHFENLASFYRPRFQDKDLQARVLELNKVLEERGGLVELKQVSESSFALDNYNCTLNTIARRYQSICRWELEAIRSLLGARVDRINNLASGGLNCAFFIQGNSLT